MTVLLLVTSGFVRELSEVLLTCKFSKMGSVDMHYIGISISICHSSINTEHSLISSLIGANT